jgi:predicted nucleic acid-binding Zn ribbon protein
MGIADHLVEQKAVILWLKAVGKEIKKQTVANRIEKGVLFVAVSNPVWINELKYLKLNIIQKLNQLIGKKVIKDIKFYLK